VLDGEILAWARDAAGPMPFQVLQTRLQRKTVTPRLQREVPVRFLAYDLLESDGVDRRGEPQHGRRGRLEALAASALSWAVSPLIAANGWNDLAHARAESRALGVEGLMLKHRDARYGTGRTKSEGVWWKWKIDPLSVDAVLLYAQAGHGRRASVYTDYTFAVWNRPPRDAAEAEAVVQAIAQRVAPQPGSLQLVPFAKAYSGLTDAEFEQVSRIVRATTLEKFGPVRSVRPTLVFELGFEGLQESRRHRSGIAVRFPRMLRWRQDKPLWQADALPTLQGLLHAAGRGGEQALDEAADEGDAGPG
jgi:DNA ligase 1